VPPLLYLKKLNRNKNVESIFLLLYCSVHESCHYWWHFFIAYQIDFESSHTTMRIQVRTMWLHLQLFHLPMLLQCHHWLFPQTSWQTRPQLHLQQWHQARQGPTVPQTATCSNRFTYKGSSLYMRRCGSIRWHKVSNTVSSGTWTTSLSLLACFGWIFCFWSCQARRHTWANMR
jgi:hypothetical protein